MNKAPSRYDEAVEDLADAMGVSRIAMCCSKVVGFDADDTLWQCQDGFIERLFVDTVSPYASPGVDLEDALRATELGNLAISGYGVEALAFRDRSSGDLVGGHRPSRTLAFSLITFTTCCESP